MKGFPHKNWLGSPKGWKDLGEKGYEKEELLQDGWTQKTYIVHPYCRTRVNIGKEGEKLFQFCSRCMVRVEDSED